MRHIWAFLLICVALTSCARRPSTSPELATPLVAYGVAGGYPSITTHLEIGYQGAVHAWWEWPDHDESFGDRTLSNAELDELRTLLGPLSAYDGVYGEIVNDGYVTWIETEAAGQAKRIILHHTLGYPLPDELILIDNRLQEILRSVSPGSSNGMQRPPLRAAAEASR